jgi:hypothetical protein
LKTHVVTRSKNSKIGPMTATYRTQDSCPTTCPLLGNGCYAGGRIFGMAKKFGQDDVRAVSALAQAALPNGVRFNVSGDFLTDAGEPDLPYIAACNEVAAAHPDALKIAYTHAWRQLDPSAFAFTVNASCETAEDVAEAVGAGWEAVIVNGKDGSMMGDKRVVTCLAETRGLSCAECGLCGQANRTRPVVSFTAHGSGSKKVSAAVAARVTQTQPGETPTAEEAT